jgi:hypothetical protein
MRPTPSELASGLRRTLRDVVAPGVSGDYAAAQLHQVVSVLGRFDWDNAALDVVHETRRLAGLLAECLAWLEDSAATDRGADVTADVRAALDGPLAADRLPRSFTEANDQLRCAEAALDSVIATLGAHLAAAPDDEGGAALRHRITAVLAGKPGEVAR